MNIQLFKCLYWDSIFFSLNYLAIFIENQFNKGGIYFWTLSSIPSIYMPVFMTVPHNLDYCSFEVRFEFGKCESSNFALFQECFGYSRSLEFQYEIGDILSISAKKLAEILIANVLNLWSTLISIAILYNNKTFNPWTCLSIHLRSVSFNNVVQFSVLTLLLLKPFLSILFFVMLLQLKFLFIFTFNVFIVIV